MKINGKPYRTIWPHGETSVEVIDQTKLPHELRTVMLRGVEDAARAIKQMIVRGATLRQTMRWIARMMHCWKPAPPRSTCAGR
jgi:methylthioribose-1-phosphate isomerase